MGYTAQQL